MESFSDLLATVTPDHSDAGLYKAKPSDLWMQGRSLFGGASTAIAVKAARLELPDDQKGRPLRSILVSFAGPIGAGDVSIKVVPIRVGKSVSVSQATVYSGETPSLVLVAAFGNPRETKTVDPLDSFKAEPLSKSPDTPFVPGMMPHFLQAFQIRWTGGGIPGSGMSDRRLGMWARHRRIEKADALEALIAMGDVPPPVMMSHYNRKITASSLTWSFEFVKQPGDFTSDWFYLDYHLEAASGGYSQQAGKVYAEDGTLVAISHQCMTFFE